MSRLLYLNGGFDLGLRGAVPPRLRALLPEMTCWFVPVGLPQDRVLLDCEPDCAWLEGLRHAGLELPRLVQGAAQPETLPASGPPQAFPWGWSQEAVDRLAGAGAELTHPPLDIVARVNARSFSHARAGDLDGQVPGSRLCRTTEQAHDALRSGDSWPKVLKPDHGNAGIGFTIVSSPDAVARAMGACAAHLSAGPVVVETWLPRTMDFSTRFELGPDGAVSAPQFSRCLVSATGASLSVLHVPGDPVLAPLLDTLQRTAESAARSLHAEGYFGPVNVDGMVAWLQGREQVFPLLEINARQSMSFLGYTVQQRLAPGRPFLLKTLGRRGREFARAAATRRDVLAGVYWDRHTLTGALPLSAPSYCLAGSHHQPRRHVLFLSAATEQQLLVLDTEVSARLAG